MRDNRYDTKKVTKKQQCSECKFYELERYTRTLEESKEGDEKVKISTSYREEGFCLFNPQAIRINYKHWCGKFLKNYFPK